MPESRPCPGCEIQLPADAPEGVGPECLVRGGMRDESNAAARETVLITAGAVWAESKTPTPRTALPVSQHLGGRRIIHPLGKGGMGAVYEAEEGDILLLASLTQGVASLCVSAFS